MRITPAQIVAMTDNEVGIHLSGGHGAEKRKDMIAAIKDMARRCERLDRDV